MLLLFFACHSPASSPLDLTEPLSAAEARAGVVTDAAALPGGVSAEGQPGDIKIYNSRVQFIIQSARAGDYYMTYGGGLLDADVIRADDEPGRDLVDEASPMVGIGRVLDATDVTVISDGSMGGPAMVLARGGGAPFKLLTGALENEDLVPDRDVAIETLYTLLPDSDLLQIHTRATWSDRDTTALYGDLYLVGLEVGDLWLPGRGLDGDTPSTYSHMAVLGKKNEVVLSVFPETGAFAYSPLAEVLSEAAPVLAPLQGTAELADGDTLDWTTYVGVGRDPAALVSAWEAATGQATEPLGGLVTAGGAPVAGARVHLLDADEAPVGVAFTDADGRFSAELPPGVAVSAVATGRGQAIVDDLPPGAGWYGPYAAEGANALTLASYDGQAPATPFAEGQGVSEPVPAGQDMALTLSEPGYLNIKTLDGLPAVLRVAFTSADTSTASAELVPDRPKGLMSYGFVRDGQVTVPVEPGTYEVVVHRGARWEAWDQTVTVAAGETVEVAADLSPAYTLERVWTIDPHSHAAPSSDGKLPMEDRLIATAAHGLDLHVGTDHDHVADYRPLLAPLGLDGVLGSVVADEVSPVLRGHHNAWPLEAAPDRPNNGAPAWWDGVESTTALYEAIRAMAGDPLIQVNHPVGSSGMFTLAEYNPEYGTVGDGGRWTADFDAMEVLNAGDHEEYFPSYLDLVSRGYTPTPVGVSDSHSPREDVGIEFTFLRHDPGLEPTNDALKAAVRARGTVVSGGPFILATVDGEWAPGRDLTGPQTVDVVVYAPTWMPVDTLTLYRDNAVEQTVALTRGEQDAGQASLELDPDADAAYVIVVSGDAPMTLAYPGARAWAMASAIRIDLDGDGWEAPLPPLVVDE